MFKQGPSDPRRGLRAMRVLMSVFVLAAALAGARAAEAGNNGTNVLFIIVDDLSDWVTHLKGEAGGGPPAATPAFTPNIDALAASGVTFTRAYAPAPACSPSRSALLGGRRPGFTGVYDNSHDWKTAFRNRNIVPLTKHFKANGYNVMGVGKIYHEMHSVVPAYSNAQLFSSFTEPSGGGGGAANLSGLGLGPFDYGTPASADTDAEMKDYKIATEAIARINQTHTKPFFIAVGFSKPHLPWYVPASYFNAFTPSDALRPPTTTNDLGDVPTPGDILAQSSGFHGAKRDYHKFVNTGTNNRWNAAIRGNLASIKFVDGQIGRVLAAINASPHNGNTIVVLMGDHGFHLGEKEHWTKFALWERTNRTPLIFRGPGIAVGRARAPVDLMAVYPTLTQLCGVPNPASGFDNVSIRALLQNPGGSTPRPFALSTYWNGVQSANGKAVHSVRNARYRYTRYADGTEELYDHQSDPNEFTNQASNPDYAAAKTTMQGFLPPGSANNRPPVACFPASCP
jgi:arylsulfatase A-like enzyme